MTQPTHVRFREWLRTNRWSYVRFGKRIGVATSTVAYLANEKHTPTLRVAQAIQDATAGAIKVEDWPVG